MFDKIGNFEDPGLMAICRDNARWRAEQMATPKLQGLASAIHKLHYGLEERAAKLHTRIGEADARADVTFKDANAKLDGIEGHIQDVNKFLDAIEGSNSGELPEVEIK